MGGRRLITRGLTWFVAAAMLVAGLVGVATSSAAQKPSAKVTIKGSSGTYKFKPKKVTIKKGQIVKWSWDSDAPHNVTFGKKRHSKTAMKVTGYKLKFKNKGTFSYTCTVHGFKGKVVVN